MSLQPSPANVSSTNLNHQTCTRNTQSLRKSDNKKSMLFSMYSTSTMKINHSRSHSSQQQALNLTSSQFDHSGENSFVQNESQKQSRREEFQPITRQSSSSSFSLFIDSPLTCHSAFLPFHSSSSCDVSSIEYLLNKHYHPSCDNQSIQSSSLPIPHNSLETKEDSSSMMTILTQIQSVDLKTKKRKRILQFDEGISTTDGKLQDDNSFSSEFNSTSPKRNK